MPKTYNELKDYLSSTAGLRMSHIYKPAMLLAIIHEGGKATKEQIATEFLLRDSEQINFYRKKIVHQMPGNRLVRDGLVDKDGDTYSLSDTFSTLTPEQLNDVVVILEQRISDYMGMRNPFGDSNSDAVPGSTRYEVLKRSGSHCESCGASSKDIQIDVDHIEPRSKGGSNDISNLQALCRTCNAQKRDRDDTNFIQIHESYAHRDSDCIFCQAEERIVSQNELAFVIKDGHAVTKGHSLIIPKRHVADYFDLHMAERNALEALLHEQRGVLLKEDKTITGFNVGINAGESAGQTIFHVHIHLIPRRDGDVEKPRGGVRHVIPGKGNYET